MPDYLDWFEQTCRGAYAVDGAPWTRLGNTCDWNPATPRFGASEYHVTTDAPCEIARVATVDDDCRP